LYFFVPRANPPIEGIFNFADDYLFYVFAGYIFLGHLPEENISFIFHQPYWTGCGMNIFSQFLQTFADRSSG